MKDSEKGKELSENKMRINDKVDDYNKIGKIIRNNGGNRGNNKENIRKNKGKIKKNSWIFFGDFFLDFFYVF